MFEHQDILRENNKTKPTQETPLENTTVGIPVESENETQPKIPTLEDIETAGQLLSSEIPIDIQSLSPEVQAIIDKSHSVDEISQIVFQAMESADDYVPPFFLKQEIEYLLHYSVNEDPQETSLSPEYMAARKHFVQKFIDYAREKSREPDQKENLKKFIITAHELLFSYTPNILDYIGSYKDSLEIAAEFRTLPEFRSIYDHFIQELIYTFEYSGNQETFQKILSDLIDQSTPEKQFHIIRTLDEIVHTAEYSASYAHTINSKISTVFNQERPKSALVEIVSKAFNQDRQIGTQTVPISAQMRVASANRSLYHTLPIAKNTLGLFDTYGRIEYSQTINNSQENDSPLPKDTSQSMAEQFPHISSDHLILLQELHQPKVRGIIEDYFNIKLTDISLQSQVWLLKYLAESDTARLNRLTQSLQQCKTADQKTIFLESFLSIEQGGSEMGEKILTVAENTTKDASSKIFTKYSELVDASDASYEYLIRNASDNLTADERVSIARTLSDKLLLRGKDLLLEFSESTMSDTDILLKKLDHIKADTELFKELFRTMYQSSEHFDIAELKNIEFKTLSGTEFSSDEQEKMRAIYAANYQAPQYPESFRKKLLEGLEESFSNPKSTFYTIKKDGHIIAYNRFTPIDESHTSFGAFNVDDHLAGAKIGEALLKLSLEKEVSTGKIIMAACDSRKPIASFYLINGFIANGFEGMDGVPAFLIERNPSAQYATKDIPIDAMINFSDDTVKIRKFSNDAPFDNSLFKEGYVLTQYLIHSKTHDKYCVFEKSVDAKNEQKVAA